jgi:hypothetical protein
LVGSGFNESRRQSTIDYLEKKKEIGARVEMYERLERKRKYEIDTGKRRKRKRKRRKKPGEVEEVEESLGGVSTAKI